MKKTYITPAAKEILISANRIICESPQVGFNPEEYNGVMYSPGRGW